MKKILQSTAFRVIITLAVTVGIIFGVFGTAGLLYLLSGFTILLFLVTIIIGLAAFILSAAVVPLPDDIDPP